jgi:hypothetical protein
MDQRTTDPDRTDPDRSLEQTGDELEERIDRLDDDIDESRQKATARSEENEDPFEDVAGDWEDTEDDAGGEDPEGFDDPEKVDDDDEDF